MSDSKFSLFLHFIFIIVQFDSNSTQHTTYESVEQFSNDLYLDGEKPLWVLKLWFLASTSPKLMAFHLQINNRLWNVNEFIAFSLKWVRYGIASMSYTCPWLWLRTASRMCAKKPQQIYFIWFSLLFSSKKIHLFFSGFFCFCPKQFQMSPLSIKSHLNRILIFYLFSMKIECVKRTSKHIFANHKNLFILNTCNECFFFSSVLFYVSNCILILVIVSVRVSCNFVTERRHEEKREYGGLSS